MLEPDASAELKAKFLEESKKSFALYLAEKKKEEAKEEVRVCAWVWVWVWVGVGCGLRALDKNVVLKRRTDIFPKLATSFNKKGSGSNESTVSIKLQL